MRVAVADRLAAVPDPIERRSAWQPSEKRYASSSWAVAPGRQRRGRRVEQGPDLAPRRARRRGRRSSIEREPSTSTRDPIGRARDLAQLDRRLERTAPAPRWRRRRAARAGRPGATAARRADERHASTVIADHARQPEPMPSRPHGASSTQRCSLNSAPDGRGHHSIDQATSCSAQHRERERGHGAGARAESGGRACPAAGPAPQRQRHGRQPAPLGGQQHEAHRGYSPSPATDRRAGEPVRWCAALAHDRRRRAASAAAA
jgi:hypothetical protein